MFRLLLVLNITDVILGSFLVVFHQYIHFHGQGKNSCIFYGTEQFLAVFIGTTSTIFTFFMSFDRFIFIRRPIFHAKWNDKLPVIKLMVAFSFTFGASAGVWTISIIYNNMSMDVNQRAVNLFTNLLVLFVIVLLAVLLMNLILTHYIRNQSKTMDELSGTRPRNYHSRATKTVIWISVVQIFTLLPPVIAFSIVINIFGKETYEDEVDLIYYVTSWLMVPVILNSILNAIVYYSRNKKLQKFFKKQISNNFFSIISKMFWKTDDTKNTTPTRVATITSSFGNENLVMTTPDLQMRFMSKQ